MVPLCQNISSSILHAKLAMYKYNVIALACSVELIKLTMDSQQDNTAGSLQARTASSATWLWRQRAAKAAGFTRCAQSCSSARQNSRR